MDDFGIKLTMKKDVTIEGGIAATKGEVNNEMVCFSVTSMHLGGTPGPPRARAPPTDDRGNRNCIARRGTSTLASTAVSMLYSHVQGSRGCSKRTGLSLSPKH